MAGRRSLGVVLSLVDAGGAAAASFFAGLVSLRTLSTNELALYTLLFPAALALMLIPQTVAYLPQRLQINAQEAVTRPAYWGDSLRGAGLGAIVGLALPLAGLPLLGEVGVASYAAVAVGAFAWVLTSPLQDHVRAALHVTGHHGGAALVSAVNVTVTACAFLIIVAFDVREVPFLAYAVLAAGNLVSAGAGILVHRHVAPTRDRVPITLRNATRYSSSALVMQAAAYMNNLAIAIFLVPAALAELEAARIAAQPVMVLGIGLSSYVLPLVIRARTSGDYLKARRDMAWFSGGVIGGGLVYSALLPFVVPVLSSIAQRAIDLPLAIARSTSFALQSTSGPFNNLNLSAGMHKRAFWNSATTAALGIALNLILIPIVGVYALPISLAVAAAARLGLGMRDLRRGPVPPG